MTTLSVAVSPQGLDAIGDERIRTQLLNAARSFRYFLQYWCFRDPRTGQVLTLGDQLWSGQQEFVRATRDHDRIYALKARKIGYTTIECAHDAWCARFRDPNGRVHLFSRREDAALDLLKQVRFGLDRLPEWMRLPYGSTNTRVLELVAGPDDTRVIQAYPSDEDTAVEQSCTHAHVDEWWRMGNPERVWQAVEPTITRSCHIITTGLGPVGFPAEFWRRSLGGETGFKAFFVGALSRSDRDERWLAQKERSMTELAFKHEYPMRWEEALAAGADFVFSTQDLDVAQEDAFGRRGPTGGHKYVKAWDIGRHKDAAVGIVLDVTGEVHDVVWCERSVGASYPRIQAQIEALHDRYPGLTVIEDNAAGEAVRENLSLRPSQVKGFLTTEKTKATILTQLQLAFQQQTLRYDGKAFPQLDAELRSYQWDDVALTQDSVMALAIAEHHALEAQRTPRGKGRVHRLIYFR
jgi:hypothetical protein